MYKAQSEDFYFKNNIDAINFDTVCEIEKCLEKIDLVSLTFLLYSEPRIALYKLNFLHNNLLTSWQQEQPGNMWRYEFLEVLAICQLYRAIRKLGFDVKTVKEFYQPDNINFTVHVHPMKKALYKLCDNMSSVHFRMLKNCLKKHNIDTTTYDCCEMTILELMRRQIIFIDEVYYKNGIINRCNVEFLVKMVDNLGLTDKADNLRRIERKIFKESISSIKTTPTLSSRSRSSSISNNGSQSISVLDNEDTDDDNWMDAEEECSEHEDIFRINDFDEPPVHLKTDTQKTEYYPIKNPKRLGICYIINQENFHEPLDLYKNLHSDSLERRQGSCKDQQALELTLSSMNFEVVVGRNLRRTEMLHFIRKITETKVRSDDSMFMVIIMSHGIRDHIYSADSKKVKIEDIQDIMDSELQKRSLEIPKILILQACQVNNCGPKLVADSNKYIPKADFLTFWATSPALKAYRSERDGSIFIQLLCRVIKAKAKDQHLCDIFTEVTNVVAKICTKLKRHQLPIYTTTLRKKIFLQVPK